jgi:hypothetical protein
MNPPVYKICFPDIVDKVAVFLDICDIAAVAQTSRHFAQYTKDTGLLYRHVSLAHSLQSRKYPPKECPLPQLLSCIQQSPVNAATLTSLSIRHRFCGYQPGEEIIYIERLIAIFALCPSMSALSLHINNWSSPFFICPTKTPPKGATRAFYCHIYGGKCIDDMTQSPSLITRMLEGMKDLRSLDWCLDCGPSGVLMEDWRRSHLREELELINQRCPRLEHLGLLNYQDNKVVDMVIKGDQSDGTSLKLDQENTLSGILPYLSDVVFYIAAERDAEKIISATVLGMVLGCKRRIVSRIKPWCQDDPAQQLIVEDITHVINMRRLRVLHQHLEISLDQLSPMWYQYVHWDPTFEISVTGNDISQVDLLHLAFEHAQTVSVILKANDMSPEEIRRLHLPRQTKKLTIRTKSIPLLAIKHLTERLNLHSLTVVFEYFEKNETEEKVMMIQTRNRATEPFEVDWVSEPIMVFNIGIWGDMTTSHYGQNLFESVVGRAIGRTTWDSRKLLEVTTRDLFEKDTSLKRVEILASYPLYRLEQASPRFFRFNV